MLTGVLLTLGFVLLFLVLYGLGVRAARRGGRQDAGLMNAQKADEARKVRYEKETVVRTASDSDLDDRLQRWVRKD
jgi:hypothetical protein